MLKIDKTRQLTASFVVFEEGIEKVVKTTNINIDNQGVSSINENLFDADLYNKHRKDMRKDEAKLRELRYNIEDEITAENDQTEEAEE